MGRGLGALGAVSAMHGKKSPPAEDESSAEEGGGISASGREKHEADTDGLVNRDSKCGGFTTVSAGVVPILQHERVGARRLCRRLTRAGRGRRLRTATCHFLTAWGLAVFEVFVIVGRAVDIAVRVISLATHAFGVCMHTLEVLAQGKNLVAQGVIFLA